MEHEQLTASDAKAICAALNDEARKRRLECVWMAAADAESEAIPAEMG